MVKVPLSNSFLEKRDGRRESSESLGAGTSLAPRFCQRISLGSVNDWKGSSFSKVQQLTDGQDSTRDRSRRPVKTRPGLDWPEWPREFEIPLCHQAALWPQMTSCSILSGCLSRKRRRIDRKDFDHVPQHHKHWQWHVCEIIFLRNSPLISTPLCKTKLKESQRKRLTMN